MSAMSWACVALVLAGSELLTGTFYALMLALAAGVTALAAYLGLDSATAQCALYAVLAVTLCVFWSRRRPRAMQAGSVPVNLGKQRWLGRELVVEEGIHDGQGRVALDDTTWSVRGPDCAPHTHVRVIGMDGTTLLVELVAG